METKNVATAFEKYPAYKDSGVEWLGRIPEEWKVLPGFTFLHENKERNKGLKRNTVLSLSYGKIIVKKTDELTGLVPESFETYQIVNKGDIIFRPTDLQNDTVSLRSAIAENDGIITSAYLNLRLKPFANNKYYHYFLRAIDNNKVIYGLGSGLRQNIDFRDFKRFLFSYPPIEEQTAIASFLDEKTAKIDRAIAQKERLIELLKERKQVIVQDAVTGKVSCLNWDLQDSPINGINATATPRPMKPSGVEWIGEIPEGWEVKKLKYLLSIKNGQDYKNVIAEFGYPVYGSGGHFAFSKEFLYDGEALLLGRKGTVDKPMYVNSKFWTVDTMFYAIVNKSNSTKFLYYVAQTIPFKLYSTSTALPSMTQSDLNNHIVAVPYLNEQINIVEYIEYQQSKLETAINNYHQQIEKLKEYKAVLIDSAVTGKIKVV